MRKIYFSILLLSLLVSSDISAQLRSTGTLKAHPGTRPSYESTERTTAAGCDTINFPIPDAWDVTYYSVSASGGFVSGNNVYLDKEKANYYDVSATANTFLTKVWIAFGVANGPTLTKVVPIKVYDGTSGMPGAVLGTASPTLGAIRATVGGYASIQFTPAITLPASKKFFVSVDISNLSWTSSPKDSLVILTNDDGQSPNAAWEKWENDTWHTFTDGWDLDVSLIMHPFVSTNATCTLLPVTLSSFEAERRGTKNYLTWTTLTELNNKGYELQRSANGKDFSALQFISSKAINGNSSSPLQYSFEDLQPFSSTSYYRLKQIDKDGRFTYSNVVIVKGSKPYKVEITAVFPNPVTSVLNLVLAAPANDKVSMEVTDLAGKTLIKDSKQVVSGDNKVVVNVSSLPQGSYILKVVNTKSGETSLEKFVKK